MAQEGFVTISITIGEILDLDARQVASGVIDENIIQKRLEALLKKATEDPEGKARILLEYLIENVPALAAIVPIIQIGSQVANIVAQAGLILEDAKKIAESFTPVLNFSAIPKLIGEKAATIGGVIFDTAKKTVIETVARTILEQELTFDVPEIIAELLK